MVQIKHGVRFNIPATNLSKISLNAPGKITPKTEGNNSAGKPLRAINRGNGSKDNPYRFENDQMMFDDFKYIRQLAKVTGTKVYYTYKDDENVQWTVVMNPDGTQEDV